MIEQIRPVHLAEWLTAHPGGFVLDVREPWELQTASIAASPAMQGHVLRHVPMQSIAAQSVAWDKTTPMACLCHHGGRSQQVALFLERQGFAPLANVAGGIHAWSAEVDAAVPVY